VTLGRQREERDVAEVWGCGQVGIEGRKEERVGEGDMKGGLNKGGVK